MLTHYSTVNNEKEACPSMSEIRLKTDKYNYFFYNKIIKTFPDAFKNDNDSSNSDSDSDSNSNSDSFLTFFDEVEAKATSNFTFKDLILTMVYFLKVDNIYKIMYNNCQSFATSIMLSVNKLDSQNKNIKPSSHCTRRSEHLDIGVNRNKIHHLKPKKQKQNINN